MIGGSNGLVKRVFEMKEVNEFTPEPMESIFCGQRIDPLICLGT